MLWTTFILSLREIRRHKLRSFLTTLGVIIGITGILTMTTLGKGGRIFVEQQIASLGTNAIFVIPVPVESRPLRQFDQGDVDAIRGEVPGARIAAGQVQHNAKAFHNGQNIDTVIEGVGNDYMDARGIKVDLGRRFSAAEERSGAKVCIIGPAVRAVLFEGFGDPVGRMMRLDDVPCRVIGVFKSRAAGESNRDTDEWVLMPLKGVQRRYKGNDDIGAIVVAYDEAFASDSIQQALVGLLRERRGIQEREDPDFDMVDTRQLQELAVSVTAQLTMFVAGIAGISLVVGGIGIMNIMLVTVGERKREIGIRLAVGARAREIQLQFLTEAVVLCFAGCAIGTLIAAGISFGVLSLLGLPFVFDLLACVASFAVCALIGIAFGYYPARQASLLDPMDVLRGIVARPVARHMRAR